MTGTQRRTAALIAALLSLALAACTPEPAPTPTPTGFASEEEAFAAAEATYRAYVDAVNARRSDPESSDPNEFLSGSALEGSIAAAQQLEDAGVHLEGPALVTSITRNEASSTNAVITACVDSSATRVVNTSGDDVTPTTRADQASLEVEVVYSDPTPLVIRSEVLDSSSC